MTDHKTDEDAVAAAEAEGMTNPEENAPEIPGDDSAPTPGGEEPTEGAPVAPPADGASEEGEAEVEVQKFAQEDDSASSPKRARED